MAETFVGPNIWLGLLHLRFLYQWTFVGHQVRLVCVLSMLLVVLLTWFDVKFTLTALMRDTNMLAPEQCFFDV